MVTMWRGRDEAVVVQQTEGAGLDEFGFVVVSLASSPPLLLAQDPRYLLLMAEGDFADGAVLPEGDWICARHRWRGEEGVDGGLRSLSSRSRGGGGWARR
jgi:hypothetical protein